MHRFVMLFGLAFVASVCAQDKKNPPPKVDQAKIDAAIDKGGQFLLGEVQRGLPTLTHNMTKDLGYEELVLYTLIHAGVDPGNDYFKKLLEKVETAPLQRTYRVVLTALSLEALDKQKYQDRIADCAQFLADNQAENGQWSYGEETKLPKRDPPKKDVATGGSGSEPKSSGGSSGTKALPRIKIKQQHTGGKFGDDSNTQYAALGIRACVNAGCEFDRKIIELAAKWWEECQQKDGSWGYCSNGSYTHGNITSNEAGYGSMTCGGIGSLCIYRWILKQDYKHDKVIAAGADWLAKNLTFKENPKYTDTKRWLYYFIYAIERAGMLYGTEKFGSHEWYPEGVEWLLKEQNGNGMWEGPEKAVISDTCFAILFLRRATKPLPKVATGK